MDHIQFIEVKNKMPKEIEKAFEKEYMHKGKTKKEADLIFYKWEAKHHMHKHHKKQEEHVKKHMMKY